MTSPFWTIEEAAQYLKMDHLKRWDEAIQRYVRSGKLRALRRGRLFLFLKSDLDNFLRGTA